MYENAIAGREGGEAVAELLRSLPAAVKHVDLTSNQLGPEGGKAIAAALPASAVETMWLDGNGFDDETEKALRDAWGDRPGWLSL